MNTKNTILFALIFVVIYNILFFQTTLGIGLGILFLLLNIFFFLTRNRESKNFYLAINSSIISIVFSFLFAFRGNAIVQIIDLTTASFFSLTALYLYKYTDSFSFKIPQFIFIPFQAVEKSIGALLGSFKKTSEISEGSIKNNSSSLMRGLLIAIPIFAILLILLTKADPIFGKFTQDIFKNIGERTLVSIIIFIILMGLGLSKFLPKFSSREEGNIPADKLHELTIVSGSIIGLFTIFILVQFRYLFVSIGERELHQLGITSLTYSEYVRKGFFELLIAATLSCGVIVYIFRYLHKLNKKSLLQIFSAVLTIETGLLLLSAAKRLVLYADAHGLTRARVFGFIFLIWLTILLLIFLIKVFKELKEKEFFANTVFLTLITLFLINFINIDGLIAQKYKPTVNGEIDYYYLTNLSTDAKDAWKESILDAEKTVTQLESLNELSAEDNRKLYWAKSTMEQLNLKITNIEQDKNWQAFNFSEYSAYKEITENTEFERVPSLLKKIHELEYKVNKEIRQNTSLDRSTNPPLLQ